MSRSVSMEEAIGKSFASSWDDFLYFPFPCRCKCHAPSPRHEAFIMRHHEACCSKSPCGDDVAYGLMLRHIEGCDKCKRIFRERSSFNGGNHAGYSSETSASIAPGGCCSDDDFLICHCECHDPEWGQFIEHVAPCCQLSPCGLRIVTGALQLHIHYCEQCKTIGEQARL
jgi:hypothetical protein